MFKPHRESTASGFGDGPITTVFSGPTSSEGPPQDIGLIIKSLLTTAVTTTVTDASRDPLESGAFHPPHVEYSESGFAGPSSGQNPGDLKPLTAGTRDFSPPGFTQLPILTRHEVTVRPIPMTITRVTTSDGITSTQESVDYKYMVGSSTLAVGTSVTINDVMVALTTDLHGSTVLIAGDTTTTLSAPIQGHQIAQHINSASALSISTTIVGGTTKYIFAGQTLAPDQPVTVGDTPISIMVTGTSTILVIGDATTTLAGGLITGVVTNWGPSTVATPVVATGNGEAGPASTSTKAAACQFKIMNEILTMAAAGIAFIWILD
ncbi:Nn.00g077990.m01.CDS01 [Neocucurbitaria sp. VM-36]